MSNKKNQIPGTAHSLAALILISISLPFAAKAKSTEKPEATSKPSLASSLASDPSTLDSTKIRKLYLGGDFEEAIESLEVSLKGKQTLSHGDSAFIFKHLGVMYAASYETREKGKYFMHQLLQVEPTARIMDMYASDMIYMIFKNIQEEYETTRQGGYSNQHPQNQTAAPEPKPFSKKSSANTEAKASSGSSNGRTMLWVSATTVVIAAGVITYLAMEDQDPKTKINEHPFLSN